ncbi:hypothetical protein LXL04_033471 [Taraxacum kok-saghyz]
MKGEKNRWDPNGENLHPPPMCNARSALHRGISTEDTTYTRDGSCAELVGAVKPDLLHASFSAIFFRLLLRWKQPLEVFLCSSEFRWKQPPSTSTRVLMKPKERLSRGAVVACKTIITKTSIAAANRLSCCRRGTTLPSTCCAAVLVLSSEKEGSNEGNPENWVKGVGRRAGGPLHRRQHATGLIFHSKQGLGKTVSVIALIQMQKFLLTQKSVDLDNDNDKVLNQNRDKWKRQGQMEDRRWTIGSARDKWTNQTGTILIQLFLF